ncbi:MAG: helix-turn-helix domain-containing protein [Clostridiales bacterium]|jgi:hypothetical protein|nr:helix-turn-helix domain-containing protein [Clostridiales bacterium]
MTNDTFRSTLAQAVAGSHEALEEILKLYEPLIRKHSYLNGKQDDDLRQYLMIHIALSIHKFPL